MASTATALVALAAIFSFFEFVDEMGDLGRGRYGVLQIVEFVLLSIPRLCYDLFPIAALLGSLFALGALVSTSEMTVIRAAGVSLSKTVSWVMKAGALIMIACVLIGELVAPCASNWPNIAAPSPPPTRSRSRPATASGPGMAGAS